MKASELIGKRVTINVLEKPCRVVIDGTWPLLGSVIGTMTQFIPMPLGPIGFLLADDGRHIAFDAGMDIARGIIEIVLA